MESGTIEWSCSNLSDYQTFAESETDYGCLFQWGYDNALSYQSSTTDGWHTTPASDDWYGVQGPCPSGWRLPTLGEINNLINLPADNTIGTGTPSGTWTTYSWSEGAGNGALFTPKAGDTGKTLRIPNAGVRGPDGTAAGQGTTAEFWSSTAYDGTLAFRMAFASWIPAGHVYAEGKLYGYPVRCVRTVE
jgi:uncharacterized protein (TIGR02145 family)